MLELVPISLREANQFVENFHRHNGRTSRDGGKFAIGAGTEAEGLIGVAIVGRPLSATFQAVDPSGAPYIAEVLRTCTRPEAPKNANSFLYGACWRAWRAMGGKRLITYTKTTESGASLRAAGFTVVAECKPSTWNRPSIGRLREWQPIYGQTKFRWEKTA